MAKLNDKIKNLVDQKRYNEAITILSGINDPRATDWIRRIEAMKTVHIEQSRQRTTLIMFLIFGACMASCLLWSLANWNG